MVKYKKVALPIEEQREYWSKRHTMSQAKYQELLSYLIEDKDVDVQLLKDLYLVINEELEESLKNGKVIVCDTIVVWLNRAATKSQSDLAQLNQIVNPTVLHSYVVTFWNDSGAALGNSLKELFIKLVSFIKATKSSCDIFSLWLSQCLQMSPSSRVMYFMIEHLYKECPPNFILENKPNFIQSCLVFIGQNALSSVIGRVLSLILKHISGLTTKEKWVSIWFDDVVNAMKDDNKARSNSIQVYLLPQLFVIDTASTMIFLQKVVSNGDMGITLSCLKVAQQTSVLIEPFLSQGDSEPIISLKTVHQLLTSKNGSYRSSAMSLLTSSPKLSHIVNPSVYPEILKSMSIIMSDSDKQIRSEMISHLYTFINRIRDSTYCLQRDYLSLTKKDSIRFHDEIEFKKENVKIAQAFLANFKSIIQKGLQPGKQYEHRATSLELLTILVNSGLDSRCKTPSNKKSNVKFAYSIDLFDRCIIRLLLDLIGDDFEDIRTMSNKLVMICPLDIGSLVNIPQTKTRSMKLLGDLKGKSVDSGGRFFQFLFNYYQSNQQIDQMDLIIEELISKLELCIEKADLDIYTACYQYSIQGYFAALKFIMEIINLNKYSHKFYQVSDKLVYLSIQCWNLVKPFLQHDSPEGNLPDELKESYSKDLEIKYGKGSQVILSYSWRAIKESTTMLEVIIKKSLLFKKFDKSWEESILQLSTIVILQLTTIRHRGAFSSIYPTFATICEFFQSTPELKHYPKQWLKESLDLTSKESKSVTRRSAGMPFVMCSILRSDMSLLDETVDSLSKIAQLEPKIEEFNDINLPQVNSMNCLKIILTDSQITQTSNLISKCISISLNGMVSDIWSVRNASLMLISAVMSNVKGMKGLTSSGKVIISKYKMKDSFLSILSLNNDRNLNKIYPVLTILSRLANGNGNSSGDDWKDFKPLIFQLMSNKNYKVREMAARCYALMCSSSSSGYEFFGELLDGIQLGSQNWNFLHGCLICQKEMINLSLFIGYKNKLANDPFVRNTVGSLIQLACTEKLPWLINLVIFQNANLVKYGTQAEDGSLEDLKSWFDKVYHKDRSLDGSRSLALKEAYELLLLSSNGQNFELIKQGLSSSQYELQLSSVEYLETNLQNLKSDQLCEFNTISWRLINDGQIWKYIKANLLVLLKDINVLSPQTHSQEQISQLVEFSRMDEDQETIKLASVQTLGSVINSEDELNMWIAKTKLMMNDNELIVRETALKGLIGYHKVHRQENDQHGILFAIEGLIYQFLNDDDQDLIFEAGHYLNAHVINEADSYDVMPVEVQNFMLEYIIDRVNNDETLLDIIVGLDCSQWKNNAYGLVDMRNLDDIIKSNTTNDMLFAQENRDRHYSPYPLETILKSISSEILAQNDTVNKLAQTLELRLDEISQLIVSDHQDGPLGILSDPKTFTMVYGCLLIAKNLPQTRESEPMQMIQLLLNGHDEWHDMVYHLVK